MSAERLPNLGGSQEPRRNHLGNFQLSDGPMIVALQRYGYHALPTSLVLTFNEALDPTQAQNVKNYQVVEANGRKFAVRSAIYNASSRTVTMDFYARLNLHNRCVLTVNGSGSGGLSDIGGRFLDGTSSGGPGSNHVKEVIGKDLVLPDPIPKSFRSWLKGGLNESKPMRIRAARNQ